MARNRLTEDELKEALTDLEGWQKVEGREAIQKLSSSRISMRLSAS